MWLTDTLLPYEHFDFVEKSVSRELLALCKKCMNVSWVCLLKDCQRTLLSRPSSKLRTQAYWDRLRVTTTLSDTLHFESAICSCVQYLLHIYVSN